MTSQAQSSVLTTGQLAAMTPAQQQAYLSTLSASDAAAQQAALASYKTSANMMYLSKSNEKRAVAYPASGGTTSTYAAGTTLVHNFPTASGAFAKELIIEASIAFTPATGTSATYGWTAAGAYAWFTEIDILFNGNQARIRPYFLKVLDTIRRNGNLPYAQVLSGLNAISNITTNIAQAQPTLTGGTAATSAFYFRIPLNAIHYLSPVGLLPIQGSGTKPQVTLQCASTLGATNADPLLVPVLYTGGTGNAITLGTATVKVMVLYLDGTNMDSPTPLNLDLSGLPTAQYVIDTPLSPLAAGSVQRQRIASLLQHYVAVSIVIDGAQSTSFATAANITAIELDQDSVGQNAFWRFGANNNSSIYDYYEQIRHVYGQDLDQGVILWVSGQQFGQENPDNRMGNQALNMTAGGWTDVNTGVQVTSVSSTNFTPRTETYLLSVNPAGLVTP